jgi:Tfp pilus assembly PilM family ATPase
MSVLSALTDASGPPIAVELAATRVSAAALDIRGGRPAITAHAVEPLPPGALVPSLTAANVHDRATVGELLARVLERVGGGRRVGLVIPDLAAKVSLVRFEKVPSRAADLDQLVRWQVKKSAPFPIEEAQVAYVPGAIIDGAREFIVTVARTGIIGEYEALCAEAGAHAGVVDIATFNVINAVLAGQAPPAGDWLLVNMAGESASLAILRGADLIFFRNRAADTDGTLADLVHQTAMYYEDRLKGGGFARVIVSGAGGADPSGGAGELRRNLEERLSARVDTLDPRSAAALTDRIAAAPAQLDALAPLIGLLVRGREAAA